MTREAVFLIPGGRVVWFNGPQVSLSACRLRYLDLNLGRSLVDARRELQFLGGGMTSQVPQLETSQTRQEYD
jgi:hypothetical protein